MESYYTLTAFLFGAVVGSFLNVVIYRLPLGISIVTPRSRCPSCGGAITALQNIPILSYLLLRGRCAKCGAAISLRYPFVEALTGALWAGAFIRFGPGWQLGAAILLLTGLVAVTFIDLDHRIIPDSLSLGGIPTGFALSFLTGLGWKASLYGIALGGGSLWAVAEGYRLITKREGMGFGDVKLLAALGAFLGWEAVLFIILIGSVVGALVGLVAAWAARGGRYMEIPFGPFLSFAAALYVFVGPQLMKWYMGLG